MLRASVLSAGLALCGFVAFAESHSTAQSQETKSISAEQEIDVESAKKIFHKSCRACHGNKAQGAASYPKLSDKEPDDIAEKLKRYRAGEKIGPNSILMIQHAKKLSDEDIVDISVYVATAFD